MTQDHTSSGGCLHVVLWSGSHNSCLPGSNKVNRRTIDKSALDKSKAGEGRCDRANSGWPLTSVPLNRLEEERCADVIHPILLPASSLS